MKHPILGPAVVDRWSSSAALLEIACVGAQSAEPAVDPGLLDCIQVNLAVLADAAHGAGTHLWLGEQVVFRAWPGEANLPTVDPPLDEQLRAARAIGLTVVQRQGGTGADIANSGMAQGVRYVVADAFELPWLPYHRNAHMPHSFLLTREGDRWYVVDAYQNETRWGAAAPGRWELGEQELQGISRAEVFELAPADPDPTRHDGSATPVDGYLAAYRDCPDRVRALERLTAETWLLARARKLHARFRQRTFGPPEPAAEHLRSWDHVVEQTYLAFRRVSRGHPEPPGVLDRLAAVLADDTTVFAPPPDAVRSRIADLVGAVLGVPTSGLVDGTAFDAYPTFGSFRLVEIIESIEDEFAVEIPAELLVPEKLRTVDDLRDCVRAATPR
ncbi:acyl carrier protein [Nocardia brasiliensis]|uniref:acyl carrier protein n=1 Tax=Nocardia brasiliensis TaxID=37326 RepID=UPI00366F1F64